MDFRILIFLVPKGPYDMSVTRQFMEKFSAEGFPVKIFFVDINNGGLMQNRMEKQDVKNLGDNYDLQVLADLDKNLAEFIDLKRLVEIGSEKEIIEEVGRRIVDSVVNRGLQLYQQKADYPWN